MPDWPDVTVVICTYNRPVEIRKTIDSMLKNLRYPPEHLLWLIADDGTVGDYPNDVCEYILARLPDADVSYTITERRGWGANVNKALKEAFGYADYVYFTEDDYLLLKPLDLRPYIAAMEVDQRIGLVRFGIAGHSLTCGLHELDISDWIPDYQENDSNNGYSGVGKINMWYVDRISSRGPFSNYQYSNRPHLKHRRFHETYRLYPEGLTLGETEEAMNRQMMAEMNLQPYITCPANWTLWHYDHCGQSRQGTREDVHA